jgi:hypothetical protein
MYLGEILNLPGEFSLVAAQFARADGPQEHLFPIFISVPHDCGESGLLYRDLGPDLATRTGHLAFPLRVRGACYSIDYSFMLYAVFLHASMGHAGGMRSAAPTTLANGQWA